MKWIELIARAEDCEGPKFPAGEHRLSCQPVQLRTQSGKEGKVIKRKLAIKHQKQRETLYYCGCCRACHVHSEFMDASAAVVT